MPETEEEGSEVVPDAEHGRTAGSSDPPLPPTEEAAEADPERTADRIHSAAIHLLRRLRVEDAATGLTAPRLSALSVVVHAGPLPIGDLAAAEQVRPPSMTRLVAGLERDDLVARRTDPADGRVQLVEATPRGRSILEEGRARRVRALARELVALPSGERSVVARAAEILERLALPADHPARRPSGDDGGPGEGGGRGDASGPGEGGGR